jgi:plastocyanin domain-containing protein
MTGAWAVNLGGLVLIALIVWWFWLSGPKAVRVDDERPIDILVEDGVYSPARIEVASGKPVSLRFLRKDASPCAEKVVFPELNLSADLPVGKTKVLTLPAIRPGEYEFTCQMRMYRGQLVARS